MSPSSEPEPKPGSEQNVFTKPLTCSAVMLVLLSLLSTAIFHANRQRKQEVRHKERLERLVAQSLQSEDKEEYVPRYSSSPSLLELGGAVAEVEVPSGFALVPTNATAYLENLSEFLPQTSLLLAAYVPIEELSTVVSDGVSPSGTTLQVTIQTNPDGQYSEYQPLNEQLFNEAADAICSQVTGLGIREDEFVSALTNDTLESYLKGLGGSSLLEADSTLTVACWYSLSDPSYHTYAVSAIKLKSNTGSFLFWISGTSGVLANSRHLMISMTRPLQDVEDYTLMKHELPIIARSLLP